MNELVRQAKEARSRSYSPYSRFAVGAALRTVSGKVYLGCNVENASYGLTVCAERVVIYNAISDGARDFEVLAIFTEAEDLTPPCGACRQVLWEFAKDLTIVIANPGGEKELRLAELIPMPFDKQSF